MDSLSGGEKVKAQMMRLLMSQPTVLLLDEPSNDLSTKEKSCRIIRRSFLWVMLRFFICSIMASCSENLPACL